MLGAIDVGGGMRGAYTAGIYDYLLDHKIHLPYCIGVSAGSINMVCYIAGERGRSIDRYVYNSHQSEYMGVRNLKRVGAYVDLDYACADFSGDSDRPFDFEAFQKNQSTFFVVGTHAATGEPHYFTKSDISRDNYDVLKASCSLPLACGAHSVKGEQYFDGGVADPIPYKKALSDGCTHLLVLLTRPIDEPLPPVNMAILGRVLRRYPEVAEQLRLRHVKYNSAVSVLRCLEDEGKALILAPSDIRGTRTLSRSRYSLLRLYNMGYGDGALAAAFIARSQP